VGGSRTSDTWVKRAMDRRNLVLIGFMGTGKTTIGRHCAARRGVRLYDSDHEIERRAGCSIPHLFAARGEATFRELERDVIADLSRPRGVVLSTGGGVPLDAQNAACLRAGGLVILLKAAPEVILRRIGNAQSRPLLAQSSDPRARIAELLEEREEAYRTAAHCCVDTTGRTTAELVSAILMLYDATAPA
jgi:shikimate kinase